MPAEKVYVINSGSTATPAPHKRNKTTTGTPASSAASLTPSNWTRSLLAYVLGPISLILWPRGRGRMAWAITAGASLLALIGLCLQWDGFARAMATWQHGVVAWVVIVALVIQLVATAWARAIGASSAGARWPRVCRSMGFVAVAGLVLPGLGLLMAGRRWRAACAVWFAGLTVAGMTVLSSWLWLATHYRGLEPAVANPVDAIFVAAAVGALMGLVAWLVQALDGVRVVSSESRTGTTANVLGLVMVLVLVAGIATLRPQAIASELSVIAAPLRAHGLRRVPLAIYDIARTLDPGTPEYWVAAETMNRDLGMNDAADAKRTLLEKRAAEYANAVNAELIPRRTDYVSASSLRLDWTPTRMFDRDSPVPE